MQVRITTGKAAPGQLDELARQWKMLFGEQLRTMPGFVSGQFAGDRATESVIGITLWDDTPDLAVVQQHLREFMAQAGHLTAGPPQAAVYEVLAEV